MIWATSLVEHRFAGHVDCMCGRIGRPELTWRQLYEIQRGFIDAMEEDGRQRREELEMSWNVKPTQDIEIAFESKGKLISFPARWWFVPHWFDASVKEWKQTTFNARIETADTKPTFRKAWSSNRCIIPVSGYYEWTGPKGRKQPHWITTKSNSSVMLLAGLYSRTLSGLYTCTILTRPALSQIEHIHSRTPVILHEDELLSWLRCKAPTLELKSSLGTRWDGRMQHHRVLPFKRDDDGPELIEPIAELL